MWEIPAGLPASEARPRRLSAFVYATIARARTVIVPYRLGDVVVGDDPFNGRREGVVAVKNGTLIGLQTTDRIFYYDYRQLRRRD